MRLEDEHVYNALLISADAFRLRMLQFAATESGKVRIAYSFDRYPVTGEVLRMLKMVEADLVLLDMDDQSLASSVADSLRTCAPETLLIAAVSHDPQPGHSTALGIGAQVGLPCPVEELLQALATAEKSARRICQQMFAFLPAKAGSGCSTVVLNTGASLARTLGKKVLVVEADLRSGALSLALNADNPGSIQQALQEDNLNSFDWSRFLLSRKGLDLLLSDRTTLPQVPGSEDYNKLIRFFETRYESILVDLPELVNPGTAELVRQAQSVFVVCTQEILSLKLAENRFRELAGCGVASDRIKVLLNRWHASELPREDVSRLLKRSITALFPNDYRAVRTAIVNGSTVAPDTQIGASFLQFACALAGAEARKESTRRWPMAEMLKSLVRF